LIQINSTDSEDDLTIDGAAMEPAPDGTPVAPLPAFTQDIEHLRRLYRAMVLTRTLDAKATALPRTDRPPREGAMSLAERRNRGAAVIRCGG
jgi:hypothetical protein